MTIVGEVEPPYGGGLAQVHRFDWPDLEFTGLATVHSHVVEWHILEIVGTDENGAIGWWPRGKPFPLPPTEDTDEAEETVEITVKWDGCANYSWPAGVCTHTCDSGKNLAAMIVRVHEVTAELLPTWWENGRR